MSKLTLFNIPSRSNTGWSPNPWKTRLALNFKNIDYQTEWVEYPDIKKALSPHVPPGPPLPSNRAAEYTIPTVRFPDSSYLMDSAAIAERLESLYPSPPLHLSSPALPQVYELSGKIMRPLMAVLMPYTTKKILNPRSVEYFERTRAEAYGQSIEQIEQERGGEVAWAEATEGFRQLGEILRKEAGPFVLGNTVSYADFVIVGLLQFYKAADEKVIFERAVEIEPALKTLYEACEQWVKKDGN